jgi:hypothetical protein
MVLSNGIDETAAYAQDLVVDLTMECVDKWKDTVFETSTFVYTPAVEHEAT